MGHEDVFGIAYNGTSRKALDDLIRETICEHNNEEGYRHSVSGHVKIISGITNGRFHQDNRGIAQQTYHEDDLIALAPKTFSIPLNYIDTMYEEVESFLVEKAKEKGYFVKEWVTVVGEKDILGPGITGKVVIVKEVSPSPMKTQFYVSSNNKFNGFTKGPYPTKKVAEDAAKAILLKQPNLELSIDKKTIREDGSPISTMRATVENMRVNVFAVFERPRKNAVAKGWVVNLDCHN